MDTRLLSNEKHRHPSPTGRVTVSITVCQIWYAD